MKSLTTRPVNGDSGPRGHSAGVTAQESLSPALCPPPKERQACPSLGYRQTGVGRGMRGPPAPITACLLGLPGTQASPDTWQGPRAPPRLHQGWGGVGSALQLWALHPSNAPGPGDTPALTMRKLRPREAAGPPGHVPAPRGLGPDGWAPEPGLASRRLAPRQWLRGRGEEGRAAGAQRAGPLIPSLQSAGRGHGTASPPTIKNHVRREAEPAAFHQASAERHAPRGAAGEAWEPGRHPHTRQWADARGSLGTAHVSRPRGRRGLRDTAGGARTAGWRSGSPPPPQALGHPEPPEVDGTPPCPSTPPAPCNATSPVGTLRT